MDAKDLRTQTTINERSNDGRNKYSSIDNAVQLDRNKPYQDIGSNSLPKVDVHNVTRPCAVIGPDRVVPTETTDTYLKKGKVDSWTSFDNYCRPPEYAQKICSYQTPTRNISPRQTFQENMQRIMVPPRYIAAKVSDEFSDKAVNQSKNLKHPQSISEIKYCEVPYPINTVSNEHKSVIDPSLINSSSTVQNSSWPVGNLTSHASRRPFDNPEMYQFPDYTNCTDPKTLPVTRLLRTIPEDINHSYPEPHYPAGNIRYKPYSTKERYPPPRYELTFPNSYHPPPPFPYNKYDMHKPVPPHPYSNYPQTPLKYIDNRPSDHVFEGYARPIQHANYNTPVRNQLIHSPYMPVPGNCLQSKFYQYPTDNPYKPANKGQYDHSKILEYENVRNRVYQIPENYYPKEISRGIPVKSQMVPNFSNTNSVHLQHMPANHLYRKDVRNYEYYQHFKHAVDPTINNHMSRLPPQFSPKAIPISPCGSLSSETLFTSQNIQEDCGYASQSSTTSTKSMDSRMAYDLYRRFDYRYGTEFRPQNPKTDLSANNSESRNKKDIDVRQFLQMWKDGDEESENNNPEFVTQAASMSINNSQKHLENDKTKDQLYVLGLVDVPSEELAKYEHIQKVSKLPDNIKGYNNIELLYQFEEVIQSSNLATNNEDKPPFHLDKQMTHIRSQTRLPRSVSPLDVEAKISQSVIHKEVGCNFEIKPCSPKMLSVEVATPVQSIVTERIIEKVTNPNIPKSPAMLLQPNKDFDNYAVKQQERSQHLKESEIPSCKMTDDCGPNDTTHSIKNNYSLQDLEGSSGVCLASLPRLDNDIELNFPEVNQQFINANKLDSGVSRSSPKSFTCLDPLPNDVSKEIVDKQITPDTYQLSPSSSETSFSKLSKFRKNKTNAYETKERDPLICAQTMRTDSVIIKNPDNTRNYERSFAQYTNQIGEKITKPINLSAQSYQSFEDLDCNVIQSSTKEVIDFSLNSSLNHEPSGISDENINNIENSSTSFEIFEQNEIKDINEPTLDSSTLCEDKNENSQLIQKDPNRIASNTQNSNTKTSNESLLEYNNFNILKNTDNSLLDTYNSSKKILTENYVEVISLERKVEESPKNLYQVNSVHRSESLSENSEKTINTCENHALINSHVKIPLSDSLINNDENSNSEFKEKVRKCGTSMQMSPDTCKNQSEISIDTEVIENFNDNSVGKCGESIQILPDSYEIQSKPSIETEVIENFNDKYVQKCGTRIQILPDTYENQSKTSFETEVIENVNDKSVGKCSTNIQTLADTYENQSKPSIETGVIENFNDKSVGKCSTNIQTLADTYENQSKPSIETGVIENFNDKSVGKCSKGIEKVIDKRNLEIKKIESDNINSSDPNKDFHDHNKSNSDFDKIQTMVNTNGSNLNEGFGEVLLKNSNVEKKVNGFVNPNSNENSKTITPTQLEQPLNDSSINKNNEATDIKKNNIEFFDFEVTSAIGSNNHRINHEYEDSKMNADNRIPEINKDTYRTESLDDSCVSSNIITENSGTQKNLNPVLNYNKDRDDVINETEEKHLKDNKLDIYSAPEKDFCNDKSINDIDAASDIEKNNIDLFNSEYEDSKMNADNRIPEINKDTYRTESLDDPCVTSNIIMENSGTPKNLKPVLNYSKNRDDVINVAEEKHLKDNSKLNIYSEPDKDFYNDKEDKAIKNKQNLACNFDGVINNNDSIVSLYNTYMECKVKLPNQINFVSCSKESFSPWIQNLFLYEEGSCIQLNAIKMEIEKSGDLEVKVDNKNVNQSDNESLETINNDFCLETTKLSNDINLTVKSVIDLKDTDDMTRKQYKSEFCLGVQDNGDAIDNIREIKSLKELVLGMVSKNNDKTIQVNHMPISEDQKEDLFIKNDIIVDVAQENKSSKIFELLDKNKLKQKIKNKLKRSLSDSALHIYNSREDNDFSVTSPKRRRTNDIKIPINNFETQIIPQNLCNIIQNTRRNSIAAFDDGENVSFCILIDNDYVIEDDTDNISVPENENTFVDICVNNSNSEEITLISKEKQSLCEYSDQGILECTDDKTVDDSWVNDVACVETVITDENNSEEAIIDELGSPKVIGDELESPKVVEHSDHESDTGIFSSDISDHTHKMKLFYGDQMWGDDANLVEKLYKMPQMEVNKTLLDRESQNIDGYRYYDKDSLERVLSEPHYYKTPSDYESSDSGDVVAEVQAPLQLYNKENTNADDSIQDKILLKKYYENCGKSNKACVQKLVTGMESLNTEINTCESSIDDVYLCNRDDSILNSSSPEVSSTTSEEKNSSILLKITNYNGARISKISDNIKSDKIRCKYTENNKYLYNSSKKTLLTKAAQKYIPPLEENVSDLKVRLPLPPKSLNKLQQLKTTRQTLKIKSLTNENTSVSKKILPKKQKQNFEDVLKSIDEIQIKMHKEKTKKPKKCVPKMVIKKKENGSHYASTSNDSYNPDLTGRKWQPWVFIEKSQFIDKMALRKKARAIFNHRKKTFMLSEHFYKYKAESSSKQFFITQPKSDDCSQGLLKCKIRLKHDV